MKTKSSFLIILSTVVLAGCAANNSHEATVKSTKFSPDDTRIVTASSNKNLRVWDVRTGQTLTEPLGHESYVSSAQSKQ